MIEVTPPDTPVIIPVVSPAVATDIFVLLQVPPAVASLNVVVLPWHIVADPVIGATGLTVTGIVT